MLANTPPEPALIGKLSSNIHQSGTFLNELLTLIEGELAVWRDRPERKPETSETILTSQLCAHMNSVTRRAAGWDILQFRTEEPDETTGGRRVDLIAAPANTTIWVEGRKYEDFDSLIPIECKRLPIPTTSGRDEREYVFSKSSTTGGIQRFKLGLHGAIHDVGGMIGYVQQDTCDVWNGRITEWIKRLVADGELGWSVDDTPTLIHDNVGTGVARLDSGHARKPGMKKISLRHLWVLMS